MVASAVLKEIQDKTSIFKASDDALCVGLSLSAVDYLASIKVDAVVVDERKGGVDVRGKFNVLVVVLDMSVFPVFGIVEKYIDALLSNSKILLKVKVEVSLEDTKNMVAQLSKSLKLQPERYVCMTDTYVWLVLSRM